MDMAAWIERWGEPAVLAMGGLVLGLGFGFFGQRSRFCLRAAVIEFWHRRFGDKLAVWLLAFSTAVVAVQGMILLGWLDVSSARQLAARGSLSGALVGGLLFGLVWMAAALWFAVRSGWSFWKWVGGAATGLMVALAWWFSYQVMAHSFEPVQIQGMTFSGPSAEWLMRVLAESDKPWTFGLGLMPGVFLGSLAGALVGREWRLEGFGGAYTMPRYIVGAMLMGFGSMLAGGCAVGAGMTGGAIFAVTAWLTLVGMWVGGGIADRLIDRPQPRAEPMPTGGAAADMARAP